jgi:hypothetical protein
MRRIFLCKRTTFLVASSFLLIALLFLLSACSPILKHRTTEAKAPKSPSVEDILVEFTPPSAVVAWGETLAVQVKADLKSGQKYPVQVKVSESLSWLPVWLDSPILAPEQEGKLNLAPSLGEARLGRTEIRLEAGAFGMTRMRELRYSVEIVRQSGEFNKVLTGTVNQDCRTVCGRVTNSGGRRQVDFYGVVLEQGQSCDGSEPPPATQRINRLPFETTEEGFGFGRTCRIAVIASPSGEYQFVNLRMPGVQVARGEVFLRLRSVQSIWLSRDNTVAMVETSGSLMPYDVLTGQVLANPCRSSGALTAAVLSGGTMLSTGGERPCQWTIQ